MNEIERVQRNIEIGYTMAVYGTRDNLHKQMLTDIETLYKHIEQGSKLPMHDVIQSDYLCDRECSGENKCDEQCYVCADMEKHSV